ncbi:MAG: sigma-70 family RNA polymerase sigma factor [Candidatus Riflebacteria bacterium]|nr:sigma-70 family RNA polymerase sigma factor [Candidatus Riflebacteria bacterium]
MTPNDMEFVKEFLSGNKNAFRFLMERYSGLCKYHIRSGWGLDSETAEDLTQEVFIKVYQNAERLRPDSHFKSWLMTILRNVVLDHLRKAPQKNKAISLEKDLPLAAPETQNIRKLIIGEALAKLPERQKEIVLLFYFWELSSVEIGKVMNLPEGTVRSDLHQARIRIAELLEDADSL